MGATTPYITFQSSTGQTVTYSGYCAGGDAAGYQIPISGTGVAAAGNQPSFTLPEGVWAIKHITGPATGKVRLWCNGVPGPVALDLATVIASVSAGNTYGRFAGGSKWNYMFVVEVALAA